MNKMQQKLLDLKISEKLPFWAIAPLVIILVFVIVFAVTGAKTDAATGFGLGIDFTGGTEMTIMVEDSTKNEHTVIEILKDKGIHNVDYIQGVTTGGQNGIRVQYKNVNSDATKMKEINDSAKTALEEKFGVKVDYTNRSSTASADLIKKAFLSVGIALILILLYIIIRFEWLSGVAAVIALLHDVFMMVCMTVICRIPVNSSFIAAIITIVAYSINNTIIVFDRVRERKKQFDKNKIIYNEVADEAVAMTLNRTLFTSLTTLIMVIMLTALGVVSMRHFTLPILFGLVAGTYSSMFLAAPLWASMQNGILRYRAKQYAKYKAMK